MEEKNYRIKIKDKEVKSFYNSIKDNFIHDAFNSDMLKIDIYHINDCSVVVSKHIIEGDYSINFKIYNENSKDKIKKTKSVLEQKIGWKLSE